MVRAAWGQGGEAVMAGSLLSARTTNVTTSDTPPGHHGRQCAPRPCSGERLRMARRGRSWCGWLNACRAAHRTPEETGVSRSGRVTGPASSEGEPKP